MTRYYCWHEKILRTTPCIHGYCRRMEYAIPSLKVKS